MVGIVGFVTFVLLANVLLETMDPPLSDGYQVLIMLLAGIVGVALCLALIKLGVFIAGAICGVFVCSVILHIIIRLAGDVSVGIQIGIYIVFAILGGYLACREWDDILKIYTAMLGSYMFVGALDYWGNL